MGGDEEAILVHKIKAKDKNDLTTCRHFKHKYYKNSILLQFGQIKACILAPSIGQDPNSKSITSKVPRIVTHSPRWIELHFLGV